jgi:methyl-accepting chemotaxis protein
MIEFKPDGTIVFANENFLGAVGYRLDEIVGKHHRMFCDPDYVRGEEYAQFWTNLLPANSTPMSSSGSARAAR